MIIERIPVADADPFDLDAVALHVRADDPEFADEVHRQARAAAAEIERIADIALLDQTVRVTLEAWPRRW